MIKIKLILILFFVVLIQTFNAYSYDRIITLAPSITKSLILLGVKDKIIGVTTYCPKILDGKEKIGTVLDPNIEKIIQLEPDLVIATKEGNRLKTVKKLQELKIKVFILDEQNSFNDICSGFLKLGKLVNKEEKAKIIIQNAKKRISNIRAKRKNIKTPSIFWEIGSNPIFTAGNNTFINDFIEFSGGVNVFKDIKTRYPQISREEVIHRNPDIIIIVNMGYITNEEKKLWQNYKALEASKNNKIFILNDTTTFNEPTPDSFAYGVETIVELLQ